MKIHQLKDSRFTSNVYLTDTEKPVLIDTGGALKEKILEWVPSILGNRRLNQIVFTHGHGDHVNSAAEIAMHFDVPFYIHIGDSALLPEAEALGEQVDCGETQLEVIHTPGHSQGSVCFYEPTDMILFSGDTVFPGGRTGRWDLKTAYYPDLVKSVDNLAKLEIASLYPGHHDPIHSNISAHITASLETLRVVGSQFVDQKYDACIADHASSLS